MKTKLKLDSLMPVLSDSLRDSLKSLESEIDGFNIESAEVERRSVSSDKNEIADGERAAIKYISTRDVDRMGEVMVPSGASLKEYNKNPIVLWAHDYSMPPIGKSEWVKADEYGLKAKTLYAKTDRAEEVWQLVKEGFVKTASIGFIRLEKTWKGQSGWDKLIEKYNGEWQTDLEKAGAWIITTKWALLEYSDVPVPMNPNALVTAVAKGMALSPQMLSLLGVQDAAELIAEARKTAEESVKKKRLSPIEVISEPKRIIEIIEDATILLNGRA